MRALRGCYPVPSSRYLSTSETQRNEYGRQYYQHNVCTSQPLCLSSIQGQVRVCNGRCQCRHQVRRAAFSGNEYTDIGQKVKESKIKGNGCWKREGKEKHLIMTNRPQSGRNYTILCLIVSQCKTFFDRQGRRWGRCMPLQRSSGAIRRRRKL